MVPFKCNLELRHVAYGECIQKQEHLYTARLKHHQRSEWTLLYVVVIEPSNLYLKST